MYYELKKEMKRKKINQFKIAEILGISQTQVSQKINKKSDFKLEEATKIYEYMGNDKLMQELFKNVE